MINVVIARCYTARDLGVFNQVYAVFVIFSQISAMGVQVSALKHVAQYSEEKKQFDRIITSALLIGVISATLFTLLLFLMRNLIGQVMDSPPVASGLVYILPGFWCFVLNKLHLNILNGFQRMKAYAFFSSLRALCILFGIIGAVIIRVDGYKLCVVFTIAECIMLPAILFYTKRLFSFLLPGECQDWFRTHLVFGIKSLGIGLLTEMNTRIDILILGIFASDRIVGIYSLAAMLIEGIFQIPFVLRRMFDPKLTKLIYSELIIEVRTLIRKGALQTFCGMLLIFGSFALLFPHAVKLLTGNADFNSSWIIFCILAAGALIQSSYIPFSGILVQGGYPGFQSLFIFLLCLTNTVLNFILIPYFGMYGAAIATVISYLLFVVYLKLFVYHAFKIKI